MTEQTKKTETNQASLADAPAQSIIPTNKETGQVATLAPVAKIQTDVMKFATALFDKERAKEFATRVALIARDNPQLKSAIERNPDGFLSAYMASVSINLMPNTPEGDAYIIPYGDKVQFQTGYKGLVKLARRSGEIKTISAELVFEGDHFDVELGTDRRITHKPEFDVDRTNYAGVTHAYATALLTNGEIQFAVMTRKELNKIQQSAKAKSTDGPWAQWPERQAIKTVVKRLTQFLPKDDVLAKAVAMDSLAEAGKLKLDKRGNVIEGELSELPKYVTDQIKNATTSEELQNVLDELSPSDKQLAQPLIDKKIEEL
ncbi:MAG TPA: recombinase RecT [Candidatus Dormibacteraeota bacterium]|nr:recombinase RecT [Candidatus Dormibacteraeota bacterium]